MQVAEDFRRSVLDTQEADWLKALHAMGRLSDTQLNQQLDRLILKAIGLEYPTDADLDYLPPGMNYRSC